MVITETHEGPPRFITRNELRTTYSWYV